MSGTHITQYRRGANAERRAIQELLHPRSDSPDLFRFDGTTILRRTLRVRRAKDVPSWHTAMRSAGSRGLWDTRARP